MSHTFILYTTVQIAILKADLKEYERKILEIKPRVSKNKNSEDRTKKVLFITFLETQSLILSKRHKS